MSACWARAPLELLDLVASTLVFCHHCRHYENMRDSKYRPWPLFVKMVEAGWLGRKSGRGFYKLFLSGM